MRDVAERFQTRAFGETLVVPEARIPQVGARIMDLQSTRAQDVDDGSESPGTIYVLDEPSAIAKKLPLLGHRSAVRVRRKP